MAELKSSTSRSSNERMHHNSKSRRNVGDGADLAGGSGSREALLTSLFVLLFLEEGLRDLYGGISWLFLFGDAGLTEAIGTLKTA
jgi:hypothetical protein